jgi:hypothetical protein
MHSITDNGPNLAAARARNESVWRASAIALYSGDIDGFLSHWTSEPAIASRTRSMDSRPRSKARTNSGCYSEASPRPPNRSASPA